MVSAIDKETLIKIVRKYGYADIIRVFAADSKTGVDFPDEKVFRVLRDTAKTIDLIPDYPTWEDEYDEYLNDIDPLEVYKRETE